jgi:hypothetical protein
MKADRVEVSRDEQKNKWLIRIKVGEEVIRRHCDEGKDVDEATLRQAAARTAAEEGRRGGHCYQQDKVETTHRSARNPRGSTQMGFSAITRNCFPKNLQANGIAR